MKVLVVAIAATAALVTFGAASADGEAGLVIEWGDGRTTTHCVAFEGESISGEELLSRSGYNINQFSGLMCAIDGVGCQHSGSFNSCTCECQTGGGDCTYWAFFQQQHGANWRYSALGAFAAAATDGDLQAWRWGPGGPASAPAPAATTFEAICGHPPGGMSTVPPSAPATTITPLPAATTPPIFTTPAGTPEVTVGETPDTTTSPTVDAPGEATATVPEAGETPTVEPTAIAASETPAPPAAGEQDDGDGGTPWPLIGFLVVAGVLGAGIVAGLVTRAGRGS